MAKAKRRIRHSNDGADIDHEIEADEMEGMEEMEHVAHDIDSTTRQAARRMQHNFLVPFDVFGEPMARLMDQNWSMFQKMMHAMREESLEFVNRRLEQTSHAIESSRDCEGISDLMSIQQEWMVNFARDYADQTKRFADLVRDFAENGTSNVSHATSEVAERGRSAVEEEAHHAAA